MACGMSTNINGEIGNHELLKIYFLLGIVDKLPVQNGIFSNASITGYVQHGMATELLAAFSGCEARAFLLMQSSSKAALGCF